MLHTEFRKVANFLKRLPKLRFWGRGGAWRPGLGEETKLREGWLGEVEAGPWNRWRGRRGGGESE